MSVVSILGFLLTFFGFDDIIFFLVDFSSICVSLFPVVNNVITFLLGWITFTWTFMKASFYAMHDFFSHLAMTFSIFSPLITKSLKASFVFLKWLCQEIMKGMFSKGYPFFSTLCWMFVSSFTFMLCLMIVAFKQNDNGTRQRRHVNDMRHQQGLQEENENFENGLREHVENRQREIRRALINSENEQNGTDPENENNNEQNEQVDHDPNPEQRGGPRGRRSDGDNELCILCIENARNYAVIPCGHLHFCKDCVENLFQSRAARCPVCNCNIREYYRIFS